MKLHILSFILDSRCVPPEQYSEYNVQLLDASSYLTDFMVRALNPEMDFDCKRINFVCTTQKPHEGIRKTGSVQEMEIPIELSYFSLSPAEQEQYLLKLLAHSLEKLCKLKEWDITPFQKHFTALQNQGSQIEFYMDKMRCKNGKITAKIFCIHTMFAANFFVDFCNQTEVLQRKPLLVAPPHILDYAIYFDKLKWTDERTVTLYPKRSWHSPIQVTMDI
jgi:hypothetical protein